MNNFSEPGLSHNFYIVAAQAPLCLAWDKLGEHSRGAVHPLYPGTIITTPWLTEYLARRVFSSFKIDLPFDGKA